MCSCGKRHVGVEYAVKKNTKSVGICSGGMVSIDVVRTSIVIFMC